REPSAQPRSSEDERSCFGRRIKMRAPAFTALIIAAAALTACQPAPPPGAANATGHAVVQNAQPAPTPVANVAAMPSVAELPPAAAHRNGPAAKYPKTAELNLSRRGILSSSAGNRHRASPASSAQATADRRCLLASRHRAAL